MEISTKENQGQSVLLRIFVPAAGASANIFELRLRPGENLAREIWLSGMIPPAPLCAGLAHCGRCRVRFCSLAPAPVAEERKLFSAFELALGWRLACRHTVPACEPLELELPKEALLQKNFIARPLSIPASMAHNSAQECSALRHGVLALDIGTTNLEWSAFCCADLVSWDADRPCANWQECAKGRRLNPQAGAGADIISRLSLAQDPAGLRRLSALVREAVQEIVASLKERKCRIRRIGLAANSAMSMIFLGREVHGLCAAPYSLPYAGACQEQLPGLPPLLIPPLPAPFVGGDLACGILALLERGFPKPFVLADLGTNGEFALLGADDRLWLCSVPLGPALEGIGPDLGQMAACNVVTGFSLGPHGLEAQFGAGGSAEQVCGISATGYLSLLAILRRWGLLLDSGQFAPFENLRTPLARRLAAASGRGGRFCLGPKLWLCPQDVELLLKVRAAFRVALDFLLDAARLAPANLAALGLGGALGEYVNTGDLLELGFIPEALAEKCHVLGNTALAGAALLAQNPERLQPLQNLCARAQVLPLADDPRFQQAYLEAMNFGS